jgi:hypothetical protein
VIKYDNSSLTECDSFNNNKPSNNKGLFKMSKSENVKEVKIDVELTIDDYELIESHLVELINSLVEENSSLKLDSKDGRKSQVLDILTHQGPINILDIASQLNISTKNVSSQLTYLRSDNHNICTNSNGLKFIM